MTALLYDAHKKEAWSPLSGEAPEGNFRGIFNLCGVVLVATNLRLIVENLMKYGLLLAPPNPIVLLYDYRNWPCLSMIVLLQVFVMAAFCIEKTLHGCLSSKLISALHIANISVVVLLPLMLTYTTPSDIISGGGLLLITLVTALKTVSFVHVVTEVRWRQRTKSVADIPEKLVDIVQKYPKSLTLSRFYYFICAPTLCFQFEYPRTPAIRLGWLCHRLVELLASLSLMVILVQQYIFPLVEGTLPLLSEPNPSFWALIERHLRLAIPSLYVWLLMFFALFHCWLNVLAEITRFADREFYLDWWNSMTFGEFWRLWNRPVHLWVMRHLYHPLRSAGLNAALSGVVVFFISAVGHEYIMSGALKILSYWAFLAMMVQVPMIIVMDKLKGVLAGTQVGNVVFWVSFTMVGEPLAVLIYANNVMNVAKT